MLGNLPCAKGAVPTLCSRGGPRVHAFVRAGMMSAPLKRQELMDRRDRGRIGAPDPHLGATRAVAFLIMHGGTPSGHDRGARHDRRVHLKWLREIPRRERRRDVPHVLADGRDPSRVRPADTVEDDAPTIGEIFKHVRRGVLIHTHHPPAARLRGRERGIQPPRDRGVTAAWSRVSPAASPRVAGQLALSTASTKFSVLVSTHSVDTASTPIVPLRSALVVTSLPRAADALISRCTTMPRRGSYRNTSTEARAVVRRPAPRPRGVKETAMLGYASALSLWSCTDASCPAFRSSAMQSSSTGRTTFRRRSALACVSRTPASKAALAAGWGTLVVRSAYACRNARSRPRLSSVTGSAADAGRWTSR